VIRNFIVEGIRWGILAGGDRAVSAIAYPRPLGTLICKLSYVSGRHCRLAGPAMRGIFLNALPEKLAVPPSSRDSPEQGVTVLIDASTRKPRCRSNPYQSV